MISPSSKLFNSFIPGLQENVKGVILRTNDYFNLFLEVSKYCCPARVSHFLFLIFLFRDLIEI